MFNFPKSRRLTVQDFNRVYGGSTRHVRGSLVWVTILPQQSTLRWGVSVGKKLDKRAVGRNRVKRMIREAMRHITHLQGVYVVVGPASPKILMASSADVAADLNRVLSRIKGVCGCG